LTIAGGEPEELRAELAEQELAESLAELDPFRVRVGEVERGA
jgi:hypothetical protein